MVGSPTNLTSSGQNYHPFGTPSYTTDNTESLQTVIIALCVGQNSICEYCRIIGHKTDSLIMSGPKFLPPSLSRKMNQFNALHDYETTEPPRYFNI